MTIPALSRRHLLLSSSALFAWAQLPTLARAEARDPRLLVMVLRGALDGLAVAAPVGDPDWVALRGNAAFGLASKPAALPLDSFFALNPAMPNLHRMYQAGHAAIVHAAATSYRDRSHFDGQDVLESGLAGPARSETGWLNRALAALEGQGRVAAGGKALAVGPVAPLVVRGPAPIVAWVPQRVLPASEDTTMRLLNLYRHTDMPLARVLEGRVALGNMSANDASSAGPMATPTPAPGVAQVRAYFTEAAGSAAKYLARADGPRVGALAFDGWDTHVREGILGGPLATSLGALDDAFAAVESNMGEAWRDTVVVAITEFGRTARINGDNGTDHGTGTVAQLIGGALKGGRVIADWPGVKPADLHEDRDLKATTDLRSILKGLLRDHLRVDEKALATAVFPDSAGVKPFAGLLA
jgi:uncharacterized protein (DUF1501 family)